MQFKNAGNYIANRKSSNNAIFVKRETLVADDKCANIVCDNNIVQIKNCDTIDSHIKNNNIIAVKRKLHILKNSSNVKIRNILQEKVTQLRSNTHEFYVPVTNIRADNVSDKNLTNINCILKRKSMETDACIPIKKFCNNNYNNNV